MLNFIGDCSAILNHGGRVHLGDQGFGRLYNFLTEVFEYGKLNIGGSTYHKLTNRMSRYAYNAPAATSVM
jgi:hypothetical protein